MVENGKKELTLRAKVARLVEKANNYRDEQAEQNSAEFQAFNWMSKDLTIMDESLSRHYCTLEGDPAAVKRVEIYERVVGIQRLTFISIMSTVEGSLKQYAVENPGQIGDIDKTLNAGEYVYLRKILRVCEKKEKVLPERNSKRWNVLMELRNILVHNAGKVTDGDPGRCDRHIFNGETLVLEHGEKVKGTLVVTLYIIDEMLDDFKGIISGLQERYRN